MDFIFLFLFSISFFGISSMPVMVGLFGDDVNDVGKAETYSWLKAGSPEQNK